MTRAYSIVARVACACAAMALLLCVARDAGVAWSAVAPMASERASFPAATLGDGTAAAESGLKRAGFSSQRAFFLPQR
jgi:hypothetical protein